MSLLKVVASEANLCSSLATGGILVRSVDGGGGQEESR